MAQGQFDRHEDHIILSPKTKVAYGLGDAGQRLINDTFNRHYLTLYNMLLGIDSRAIGLAVSIPRIFDALTDPLMGQISDNTRSRWGRRRPYVLMGGIATGLASFALWLAPANVSSNTFFVYMLVISFLYAFISKAALIPYGALGLELSIDYNERTRVQAYRTFIALLIGANLSGASLYFASQEWLFPTTALGLRVTGLIFGVMAIFCFIAVFWGTREEGEIQLRPQVPMWLAFRTTLTNRPFLILVASLVILVFGIFTIMPLGSYISVYYVFGGDFKRAGFYGMIGAFINTGIALFLLPAFAAWAVHSGKKKVYVICTFWIAITFLLTLVIYNPKYPWLTWFFSAAVALPINGINLMPNAMLADICDMDELKTFTRREGAFGGALSLLFKLAMVFPPMILGFIIAWVGFVPGAPVQSERSIFVMRMILAFVPLVILTIAAAVAAFYPLNEARVREIRAELEERRKARHNGAPVPTEYPEGPMAGLTPESDTA